jgi:dipeptide transport system substrate-binding protein
MKNGRFLLKAGSAALLAALLGAHATGAMAAKTLVFCSEGSPEGFNSQLYTLGTTHDAASVPMYNRLVENKLGSTELGPGLAESWDISADGLTYTFKLRKGVKFHSNAHFKPTRDFNADDVLFSWNRMADANHPFHKLAAGQTFAYYEDMGMAKIVDKVEKVDDYTVRFKLKHPEAPFLADMSMDFASIVSAEYADKMAKAGTPDMLDREPIGTGAFQFVSYQKDATIRYKAHDQYWEGRPKIDNLVYAITPDAAVRVAKLKAGECHVMAFPKPADVEVLRKDPNINLISKEGMNIGYVAFNTEKKPFDNKLVRQALAMAVDKAAIIKSIYQGAGVPAKTILPPMMLGYNDKIKDWPYDPAKAKELLAKAGYPSGFETEMWYLPVNRPYNPDGKRMAEMIQADWAKVGVKVKLTTFEWGEYKKRSKTGEQQTMMFGWSADNGDSDNFLGPILSCEAVKGGGNVSRWCNKEFEDAYVKAKLTSKNAERAKLYEKAQEIEHEEVPQIEVAHSLRYTPVRKEVIGFKMDITAHHYFKYVDLAK